MKPIADVDTYIREACDEADRLLAPLLAQGKPTRTLLALYVARAEALRVAREHIPAAQWDRFLAEQGRLERAFDERCDVLRRMNRELIILSGNFVGDFRG